MSVLLYICCIFSEHLFLKFLYHFIEITLQHRCSPVNLLHIFKTCFTKKSSDGLLLNFVLIPCNFPKFYYVATRALGPSVYILFYIHICSGHMYSWNFLDPCQYIHILLIKTYLMNVILCIWASLFFAFILCLMS